MIKDNNKYGGYKNRDNDDEKKNGKIKFDAFRYDHSQNFVSLFETKEKIKEDEEDKKSINIKKKTFSFFNNNSNQNGLKSREISSDDVIHQSQKSPLFKNSYENEDEYDEEKNLEDKLFAIAAGTRSESVV